MRRRGFITLVGGTAAAWPLLARAQQTKVWRVGWIWIGRSAGISPELAGFRQGLKDFGYVEGQNIIVEYRYAEGRRDRIADLVAELVQMRPDVLVGLGNPVITGLKNATTAIPIVFMTGDPVAAGYVASLARPGGNMTGVSMMQGIAGLTAKRIELLKDVLPAATRLGVMFNPDSPTAAGDLVQAEQAANTLNLFVRSFPARRGEEIEPAIAALARDGVDCMYIQAAPPVPAFVPEIGALLLKHRIPAISELRQLVESGALLSYGPNLFESTRRQAYFVDRILKGTKPADLPVEQATKLELVINMKTAKALGITIPPSMVARADEVIE
ncbi:putative ABC transport system substrate-binding protein [Rhizobiales bacterium GAS191]|nr:putative ABC transport system substrate-binding protein [Rhizobiales bacterium GAS191]